MEQIVECKRAGFEYIAKALDLDERGEEKEVLVVLYELGVAQVSHALKMGHQLHHQQWPPLQNQLLDCLVKAQDRIQYHRQVNTHATSHECGHSVAPDHVADSNFSQIVGLDKAKATLLESMVMPLMRPDIFTGLRLPSKGILLFGPPGNGKTFLMKAMAAMSKASFFPVTASSLTSSLVGGSEKNVRELFERARRSLPAIIFVDEVDSILSNRKDSGEHEASRRLKTEFFCCFDGLHSKENERLMVVGATNRPHQLDDAALRRFAKRIFVPLPDLDTRHELLTRLLDQHQHSMSPSQIRSVALLTDGCSCSDLTNLAREASMIAVRELGLDGLEQVKAGDIREMGLHDLTEAMKKIRPSVDLKMNQRFIEWNRLYGDIS